MTISISTKWEHSHIQPTRGRTHLVVKVSAEDDEATASKPYLDILLPEGARIRYIGDLPSDGFGNTAGVDLPDIESGQSLQLVFRVKTRSIEAETITPDIHLHWLDLESDTLTEIDQTGSALPISEEDSPEGESDITEIVAAARSARRNRRTKHSNQPKEKQYMRTQRHNQHDDSTETRPYDGGRGHRHGRRFGAKDRGDAPAMAERRYRRGGHRREAATETEFSRHAGRDARGAWEGMREERGHDRHPSQNSYSGKGQLHRTRNQMVDQMEMLERRVRRMQRKARLQAQMPDERTDIYKTHRHITRTRRTVDSDRAEGDGRGRHGHRVHDCGRRMGSMSNRAWRDRQYEP